LTGENHCTKVRQLSTFKETVMPTPKTISIGRLRQNPTQMIREVRAGNLYVLTDRGQPIADIAPHREFRGVPSDTLAAQLRELAQEFGPDPDWVLDIEASRAGFELSDPWEHKA
jgi:antitoxin (DNA-binding transcriptional repressor) of toxin-antitoxin stability system